MSALSPLSIPGVSDFLLFFVVVTNGISSRSPSLSLSPSPSLPLKDCPPGPMTTPPVVCVGERVPVPLRHLLNQILLLDPLPSLLQQVPSPQGLPLRQTRYPKPAAPPKAESPTRSSVSILDPPYRWYYSTM